MTTPDAAGPDEDINVEDIMREVRARAARPSSGGKTYSGDARFEVGVSDPALAAEACETAKSRAGHRVSQPATDHRGTIVDPLAGAPEAEEPPDAGPTRRILRRLREAFFRVTRIQFYLDALHQRITDGEAHRDMIQDRTEDAHRLIAEAQSGGLLEDRIRQLEYRLDALPAADADDRLGLGLQESFRGDSEHVTKLMARHLPRIREAVERVGDPVRHDLLDIGCGRGELLHVAQEAGMRVVGIDMSGRMIDACAERGLPAVRAEMCDYLASLPEGAVKVATFIHGPEHVPRQMRLVFAEMHRVLAPGGRLLLEFPNPMNVLTACGNFYIDPTHERPVHPYTVELFLKSVGFDPVTLVPENPAEERLRLPRVDDDLQGADQINRVVDRLNELLYGPQDMVVLADKPIGDR